jgi:homoserine kinase
VFHRSAIIHFAIPFMPSSATVAVPATSANLGPGFDCLGVALRLYNQFSFSFLSSQDQSLEIQVTGEEANRVKTDRGNLAYQSFAKLYDHLGQTPPAVKIEIQLNVPLARGLGSSATAIVGGLVGANVLAGSPLTQEEVMKLAIAIEGHPDNVVPALLGGCRLSATHEMAGSWEICSIPWHSSIVPVLAIPDFELSTHAARSVLPEQLSRADAIFNVAHLGLLLRALEEGRKDWLKVALHDRLHQPYRQSLIPGYEAVRSAALSAGAQGLVISGAGPTLLALTDAKQAESIGRAITEAWADHQIASRIEILQVDTQGTRVS